MNEFKPRIGAMRYTDSNGVIVSANPNDWAFSTVTMIATEWYDEDGTWKAITSDLDRPKVRLHVSSSPTGCDHEWPDNPSDTDCCTKCGISFVRYTFMECP